MARARHDAPQPRTNRQAAHTGDVMRHISRAAVGLILYFILSATSAVAAGDGMVRRRLSRQDCLPHKGNVPRTPETAPNPIGPGRLRYIHIPKTGGDSFMQDSSNHLPAETVLLGNGELNIRASLGIRPKNRQTPPRVVVLLRHPWKHVLSQFLECKYDFWGRKVTRHTAFPRHDMENVTGGFNEWLAHFFSHRALLPLKPGKKGYEGQFYMNDYNCYDPWNMQTRYLAPVGRFDDHHVASGLPGLKPNATLAIERVTRFFFVGITDLYQETVCMLHFGTTGAMPPACHCGSVDPLPGLHHDTHRVPPHSIRDLTRYQLKTVGRLVERDAELYLHGLDLYEWMNKRVAELSGVSVVCEGKIQALRDDVLRLQALTREEPPASDLEWASEL